tara:strand:- start:1184 stop:1291 length:108 start_codon:yes stop_codon:yes gene_type:complete
MRVQKRVGGKIIETIVFDRLELAQYSILMAVIRIV